MSVVKRREERDQRKSILIVKTSGGAVRSATRGEREGREGREGRGEVKSDNLIRELRVEVLKPLRQMIILETDKKNSENDNSVLFEED